MKASDIYVKLHCDLDKDLFLLLIEEAQHVNEELRKENAALRKNMTYCDRCAEFSKEVQEYKYAMQSLINKTGNGKVRSVSGHCIYTFNHDYNDGSNLGCTIEVMID